MFYDELAKLIIEKAKTFSVSSRSLYASNNKLIQKADKLKLAGRSDTGVFAQILLLTRRKLKHRGIRLIGPSDKDWVNLKETCSLATEFCHEFELTLKEGYTEYLNIGMKKMKNFSLYKFKSMHSSICNTYQATLEIMMDPYKDGTYHAHFTYMTMLNEKIGFVYDDFKDNPEKYVCFVRATAAAKKIGINSALWIKAQFAALEWGERNGVPDPYQLYGDKAMERMRKYCYENNIRVKSEKKIEFKKIR